MFTRIYALLICFACMICLTISTGFGLYGLVKIIDPELTISPYRYQHLQSNDRYQTLLRGSGNAIALNSQFVQQKAMVDPMTEMTDEDIEKQRHRDLQQLFENERRDARASLIRIAIILLVSGSVFYVHWRIAQRLERQAG